MSDSVRIPYAQTLSLAEQVVETLAPHCQRIEIAGSLRRKKPTIGDIEIIAIPRMVAEYNLFGEVIAEHSAINDAIPPAWRRLKDGSRYKQLDPGWGIPVDLFLVEVGSWGPLLAIRTGSADFSRWLVTRRALGGAMPENCRMNNGYIWQSSGPGTRQEPLHLPEESDVFDLIGLPYIPPEQRTEGLWNRWHKHTYTVGATTANASSYTVGAASSSAVEV